MGFWLDMLLGKSPLQSELDDLQGTVKRYYGEVTAQGKVLTHLTDFNETQSDINADVHTALEKIAGNATDNASFALLAAEEIDKLKARLDLLEANIVVHKRVKMKPVKGGITIKNYKLDDPVPEGLIQPADFRRDDT